MAIGDDFSVSTTGDIRHVSGTAHYTVIELHRWLQDLADDAQASGNDLIDITVFTPSARSTDQIIELLDHSANGGPTFNIDDTAAEYFYNGSVKQKGGDELYSGLQVLGAVNNANTQIMVVQDNDYYQYTTTPSAPFWGTQASGGYNGNATGGVLMQVMIKSRINGADIDGGRIRLQARHMESGATTSDSYDFFNVTLGEGVSVGALGTTPDAQNDTGATAIGAWTGGDIPTNVEGYQTIDYQNGGGLQPFYSQWTYNTNADGLKAIWEYGKYITRTGTATNIHSMDGEFFLGITHQWDYDNGAAFTEDEIMVWGTDITYGTLTGGTFTVGNYVVFGNGNAGKVVYDNGTTTMKIALEDLALAPSASDTMTEYNTTTGATGVTAVVSTATNADKAGGTAAVLAATGTTTGTVWVQLLTGSAPVDNLQIRGLTSTSTGDVVGSPTLRTVPKIFLGSYTGSHIGAFGIGYDPNDVTAAEAFTDLTNTAASPPNNQQFIVYGLVSGQDRVLVAPRTGTLINYAQFTLNTTLSAVGETVAVMTGAIPADTPQDTTIRIELDSGIYKYVEVESWTGSTFTFDTTTYPTGVDFSGDNATSTNSPNVFISYIDKLATGTQEAVTMKYVSNRNLFVRVRDGGATPIKTYEADAAVFSATGGSATASRISDI